jgi:AAA family ATP:ADP antiporter
VSSVGPPYKHRVPPSRLDRVLRIFTDVRQGEGVTALLMFANVFLILCAYYFIKPVREGWISVSDTNVLSGLTKMEVKAYSSFCQGALLIVIVRFYSRLVDRVARARLMLVSTVFAMSNLVIFWFLQPGFFIANLPWTGFAFYLWVGIFGVFIVAQFWAFVADVYNNDNGNRLIPIVAVGATAGAAFGSAITSHLVSSGIVSSQFLLLAAIVPLGISLVLTLIVDARESNEPEAMLRHTAHAPLPRANDEAHTPKGAIALILGSRYLLAVAAITLLTNWVNTNGENLLFEVVQDSLARQALDQGVARPDEVLQFTKDGTTAFYGSFYFWVNVSALGLQSLLASRLLKYGGFGAVLMLLPVVALFSYSVMALVPVLAVVKFMKIAENSTDYSINNTARHVLWLPVPSADKYKGKPTIDSLFARLGDGLAALTVLIGVQALALSRAGFFSFTVALVVVWIGVALVVVREHAKLIGRADGLPPSESTPEPAN